LVVIAMGYALFWWSLPWAMHSFGGHCHGLCTLSVVIAMGYVLFWWSLPWAVHSSGATGWALQWAMHCFAASEE
jgi:hypothetical protein